MHIPLGICASVEARGQPYLVPSFIVLYFTFCFLPTLLNLCVFACICMYVSTHMPGHTCGDLRTACRNGFSSSQHVGPKD